MFKKLIFLLLVAPLFAGTFSLAPVTLTTSYAAIATASGSSTGYPTYAWVILQQDDANSSGSCGGANIYYSVPGITGTTGQKSGWISSGQSVTLVNPEGAPEPPLYSIQAKSASGSSCLLDVTYGTAKQ